MILFSKPYAPIFAKKKKEKKKPSHIQYFKEEPALSMNPCFCVFYHRF